MSAVALAIGSTAVMAYSAYKGHEAQKEAAKEQKKANKEQRKMANLQAARERREQFRQARAAQGSLLSQGVAQGVSASSGVQGGISSISSQLGQNVSFLDQTAYHADQASIFSQRAADAQTKAAKWQAVGQLAGTGLQLGLHFAPKQSEGDS